MEGFYQRNQALGGLLESGDSRSRYGLRIRALPRVPGTTSTRLLIGVEYTRDLESAGPQDIRILYGLNTELDKLFRGDDGG